MNYKTKVRTYSSSRHRRLGAKPRRCKYCNKEFKPTFKDQYICSTACPILTIEYKCKSCYTVVTRPKAFGAGDFCSWECRQGKRPGKTPDKLDLYTFHGSACFICDEPIDLELKCPDPRAFTLDHVIPRSLGGKTDWANVVPTHALCNHKKSNTLDMSLVKKLRRRLGFE